MTFDEAFTRLLGHEGGYSNNPADPGGETMWGVTIAVARANGYAGPMRDLPVDLSKAIYLRSYWTPAGCDSVPESIRFDLFDMAVNAGVKTAIKALQRAAGVSADGVLGPVTLAAVAQINGDRLRLRFNAARLRAYADAKAWPTFGRGWVLRVASNMEA